MELCALFCTEARGLSLCQPLWMRGGGLSFLTYIIRESNILISAGLSNSDFCFHWQSKELSSVLSKFCVVGIAWNDCLKLTFYSALPSASDISSVDLSDPCPSISRLPETACPSIITRVILTQTGRFTRKRRSISNSCERLERKTMSSCWFPGDITLRNNEILDKQTERWWARST